MMQLRAIARAPHSSTTEAVKVAGRAGMVLAARPRRVKVGVGRLRNGCVVWRALVAHAVARAVTGSRFARRLRVARRVLHWQLCVRYHVQAPQHRVRRAFAVDHALAPVLASDHLHCSLIRARARDILHARFEAAAAHAILEAREARLQDHGGYDVTNRNLQDWASGLKGEEVEVPRRTEASPGRSSRRRHDRCPRRNEAAQRRAKEGILVDVDATNLAHEDGSKEVGALSTVPEQAVCQIFASGAHAARSEELVAVFVAQHHKGILWVEPPPAGDFGSKVGMRGRDGFHGHQYDPWYPPCGAIYTRRIRRRHCCCCRCSTTAAMVLLRAVVPTNPLPQPQPGWAPRLDSDVLASARTQLRYEWRSHATLPWRRRALEARHHADNCCAARAARVEGRAVQPHTSFLLGLPLGELLALCLRGSACCLLAGGPWPGASTGPWPRDGRGQQHASRQHARRVDRG